MKRILIKFLALSSQFGLDPLRMLSSLRGLPNFVKDWQAFRRSFSGKMLSVPCLHDRFEEGGTTKSEYFWQDLWVARQIQAAIVHTTAQPSHDRAAAFASFQVREDQL